MRVAGRDQGKDAEGEGEGKEGDSFFGMYQDEVEAQSKLLRLLPAKDYVYLRPSTTQSSSAPTSSSSIVGDVEEEEEKLARSFLAVLTALDALGVSRKARTELWRALAAVLSLGNIEFAPVVLSSPPSSRSSSCHEDERTTSDNNHLHKSQEEEGGEEEGDNEEEEEEEQEERETLKQNRRKTWKRFQMTPEMIVPEEEEANAGTDSDGVDPTEVRPLTCIVGSERYLRSTTTTTTTTTSTSSSSSADASSANALQASSRLLLLAPSALEASLSQRLFSASRATGKSGMGSDRKGWSLTTVPLSSEQVCTA